jgi:hypothetical protein
VNPILACPTDSDTSMKLITVLCKDFLKLSRGYCSFPPPLLSAQSQESNSATAPPCPNTVQVQRRAFAFALPPPEHTCQADLKVEFKDKVYDSNYREINSNFSLKRNSNSCPIFTWNLFFLETRYNKELVGQISLNFKFLRISNHFFLDFNSYKIL